MNTSSPWAPLGGAVLALFVTSCGSSSAEAPPVAPSDADAAQPDGGTEVGPDAPDDAAGADAATPLCPTERELGEPITGCGWSAVRGIARSLWASPSKHLYAVGEGGLVLHDDGSRWSSLELNTPHVLRGVWGTADDDVFVVGAGSSILHYDGVTWTRMQNEGDSLWSVGGTSPCDVYAVGINMILHYDGTEWLPMPLPLKDFVYLSQVWGAAPDLVFAVGYSPLPENPWIMRAFIGRYDGASWSVDLLRTGYLLEGVWGAGPTDVWAVGRTDGYSPDPFIMHFDGQTWTDFPADVPAGVALRTIAGVSSTDIWAAGAFGVVAHYDGESWKTAVQPASSSGANIWGLAVADSVFLASDSGIGRVDDGVQQWSLPWVHGATSFQDLWGSGPDNVLAVGFEGTIARYDGSDWQLEDGGTQQSLFTVWGTAADNIYATGDGPGVLHYDGAQWNDVTAQFPYDIRRIGGTSKDDLYAFSTDPEIHHFDGNSWISEPAVTGKQVLDVWARSETDVFAVGAAGSAMHFDGSDWTDISPGGMSWLDRVSGSLALGPFATQTGQILAYDGQQWSTATHTSPLPHTSVNFNNVWATDTTAVAVDNAGQIYRLENGAWTSSEVLHNGQLNGLWGSSDTDVWAVGQGATILHYACH